MLCSWSSSPSSMSNVLVHRWYGDQNLRNSCQPSSYDKNHTIAGSISEVWFQSKGAPMNCVFSGSKDVVEALVNSASNDEHVRTVDSGISIAVCSSIDNHTILVADTYPVIKSDNNPTIGSLFTHKLSLPARSVVRKVACGDAHCLVLSEAACFCFGSNAYGELGIGIRSDYCSTLQPVHLASSVKVLDVAAGNNFSVLVTAQSGHVYTFGNGAYFKLGHGDDEDRLEPTRVAELDDVGTFQLDGTFAGVQFVACGRWHTVVVTHGTNDVYGWGWNKFGNLSSNPATSHKNASKAHKEEIVALPRRIVDLDDDSLLGDYCESETFKTSRVHTRTASRTSNRTVSQEIVKVTCGSRHTALLTAAGKVIVMGPLGPSPVDGIDPPFIRMDDVGRKRPRDCDMTWAANLKDVVSIPQQHVADYHARVLPVIDDLCSDKGNKEKNISAQDCVVIDICSYNWSLVCVCKVVPKYFMD